MDTIKINIKNNNIFQNHIVFLIMGVSGLVFFLINHFYIRYSGYYSPMPIHELQRIKLDIWSLGIFIVYVLFSIILKSRRTKQFVHRNRESLIIISLILQVSFWISLIYFMWFSLSVYNYLLIRDSNQIIDTSRPPGVYR